MESVKAAVIGCGESGGGTLQNLTRAFAGVEVCGVCDAAYARAEEMAREYGVPKVYETLEDMLEDKAAQIIVNLTPSERRSQVTRAALEAGKHVYSESPLAPSLAEGAELVELAKQSRLMLGCGPDNFLGAGLQTCRKLLDDGYIGSPVGAAAFIAQYGAAKENDGLYHAGACCLTALVALLGPVNRVAGSARIGETPTHVTGVIEFEYGSIGTILASSDIWPATMPGFEIYGTEGTISLPAPGSFGGPVRLRRGAGALMEIPLTHGYETDSRGIGAADMARALRSGMSPHRASADLAYHVLEIMDSLIASAKTGGHVTLKSSCLRPEPLPTSMP
ncbi:MAG: Gfo/Idh/MocA family oxidoreductase [Oscillospiraceae bacterium]|jgi:predicted dehydrogenase|nr:Gfo/Idh/MocA family oxidoreductase [Oscillospiraceae bacterium]